jgi:HEXXH motif-containing protein
MNNSFQGQYFFGESALTKMAMVIESYRKSHPSCKSLFENQADTILLKDEQKLKYLNESYSIVDLIDSPPIDIEKIALSFRIPNSGNYSIFDSALQIVETTSYISELFNKLVNTIIPVNIAQNDNITSGVGFSLQKYKGTIFLSEPQIPENQEIQLAISLAHELGHQALMVYQIADTIIEKEELDKTIYSHARKCNRPAIQAFHACVAISFMSYFLEELEIQRFNELERDFILRKKNELNCALKESVNLFFETNFTELGKHLHLELIVYANSI